jgi:hypothetical protein
VGDEEAVAELHRLLEFDEAFAAASYLGLYHSSRGEWTEALRHARNGYESVGNRHDIGLLAGLLVRTGDVARANELLDGLGSPDTHAVPRALTIFHLICGEEDKAVDWFEKIIVSATTSLYLCHTSPTRDYCGRGHTGSRW